MMKYILPLALSSIHFGNPRNRSPLHALGMEHKIERGNQLTLGRNDHPWTKAYLWKIMEACLILELSRLLAEILHQLGIKPTLNGGHTRKRFGLLGMCVSLHGFSWVYHGCNRPWLYVGADRIVSSRVWHGLTSFFFHRPLSKHWKSTRLWRTWNCHGIGLAMKEQRPGCIWSLCIQICQGKFQLKTKEKIRYCLILVWNHFSSCTSCRKSPLSHFRLASIPCQRVLEDPLAQQLNTCPTLLMSYKSRTSIVHHDSIFIRPFRNLEPQTPVPNTRLLPLQGRCNSMTSWCSSCWLSMLRRGPEDDKDGKPFQAWEFTMRSATII